MIQSLTELLNGIPFFSSVWFGVIAMLIVGGSFCLVGLVMGDAPKRGIEPSLVQLFSACFSILAGLVIMLIMNAVPVCSWKIWLPVCLTYATAGALNFVMLQVMSYAMQRGPNGIIWSIIQSALIFPFLGGVLFFGVLLTPFRAGGILTLLAALVLFGMAKDQKAGTKVNEKKRGWRGAAFLCLAICAVQQNLMTAPSYFEDARAVTSIARSLATASGTFLGALVYNLLRMNAERLAQLRSNLGRWTLWRYIIALQFFGLVFSYTLFYPGMNVMADAGLGGICYPMMVGSCIVTFSLASVCLLKERMTLLQAIALTVCITGLVLICL